MQFRSVIPLKRRSGCRPLTGFDDRRKGCPNTTTVKPATTAPIMSSPQLIAS